MWLQYYHLYPDQSAKDSDSFIYFIVLLECTNEMYLTLYALCTELCKEVIYGTMKVIWFSNE